MKTDYKSFLRICAVALFLTLSRMPCNIYYFNFVKRISFQLKSNEQNAKLTKVIHEMKKIRILASNLHSSLFCRFSTSLNVFENDLYPFGGYFLIPSLRRIFFHSSVLCLGIFFVLCAFNVDDNLLNFNVNDNLLISMQIISDAIQKRGLKMNKKSLETR